MANLKNNTAHHRKLHFIANTFRKFISRIQELFSLEEVEVTFTQVGDTTRYSYTKIHHKHAA